VHGAEALNDVVVVGSVTRQRSDTGPRRTGLPAGRLGGATLSRPHEERRERGDLLATQSARDERDAEVPALNQLSSQGSQPNPRIAGVGELTLKPATGPLVGGVSRDPAPPARSVAIRPPPRAMMRKAVFFMMPLTFFP